MSDKPVPHKHRDVIIAWANGEEIEVKGFIFGKETWTRIENPLWHPESEYRVKPKTIKIGNVEVPKPVQESELKVGEFYFLATWGKQVRQIENNSLYNSTLVQAARCGFLHRTAEGAEMYIDALIKLNSGE